MTTALHPELARVWGHLPHIRQTGPNEWHSACPQCADIGHHGPGYPDRFVMRSDDKPRGWCRRCGFTAFADADKRQASWQDQAEWLRREREIEERRKAAAERAIDILANRERIIEQYARMEREQRAWWEAQGIPESWQVFYRLGYTPTKVFRYAEQVYECPAYVIPKFDPGWKLTNIDYRLVNPPDGAGKYRPEAGLPAAAFYSRPDQAMPDEVFVVEGSKKAMVLTIYQDALPMVIGVPGCMSWAGVPERVKDCGRVWVILDPDAGPAAHKLAAAIGKAARLVSLPTKPDDAFLYHGMTQSIFRSALRCAAKGRAA